MISAAYSIVGGDFEQGGSASRQLKELLKKLGAEPKAIRKTMIAAYEAEMNTIIHAQRGTMRVALDTDEVEVVVEDEGPGIPDIPQAMKEGFSTAPARARELGFGAGMGLPNICKNADRFSLRSTPGKGTQVRFSIVLGAQEAAAAECASVKVAPQRCRQCLACVRACPTHALRVYHGEPLVLDHLCIDCTACMQACDARALEIGNTSESHHVNKDTDLVLPGSFLGQFESGVSTHQIERMCQGLGYRAVRNSEEWEQALRRAVEAYAQEQGAPRAVLSPMCPAVVNLVRLRFPSLLDHLAPFLTPLEAAREELPGPHTVFVVVCPAQAGVLRHRTLITQTEVVTPSVLHRSLRSIVREQLREQEPIRKQPPTDNCPGVLRASGVTHVMSVLEAMEDGDLTQWAIIELYACDQGCFGSAVWSEDAFVAQARRRNAPRDDATSGLPASAVRRVQDLKPRGGLRLDPDMKIAMTKLAQIDSLTRSLPGRNCGVCGAPTCAALAEDVVLERATLDACIYRTQATTEETV